MTAMKTVELAYPLDHEGTQYDPDATVDLPDWYAEQLVRDGRARWPQQQAAQQGQQQPVQKPAEAPAPTTPTTPTTPTGTDTPVAG